MNAMNQRTNETPIVETPVEARGAVKGHNVNVVLVVSTLAVIVIFGGLWAYFFA